MDIEKNNQRDVLICDDDKEICEILKEYCIGLGYFRNIVMAHDGTMASQKLRNQEFALILIDINMPKKNGYDLLAEFDESKANKKENILIISGILEKEITEKIIRIGVKNVLVKPFDEELFKEKVINILKSNAPSIKTG